MIKQISELTSAIVGLSYEEKEEKVSTENPRVTQFFQEAEAKKTYRLSYNEALLQAETNPDGLDSSNVKKLDISVPGTPVSSRHLFAAKNKNLLDADGNSSEISEYEVIDLPDSEEVKYLAQKLVAEIENLVAKNDAATAEREEASDGSIEILNKSEAVTPNTPKSLEVEILITKPDETDDIEESSVDPSFVSKQEFHEIFEDHDLQTINEVDEPSQGKTESKDYDNSESSLTPATSTVSLEQDQDLINLELHEDKSQPSKVQEYFQSADNGSYQRGFSEVEKFNEIPQANKEKIEEYFEASKEKQTLQRTFSQALNYVPPKISIEELLVPGCPISSSQVIEMKVCGKKSDDVDAGAEKIITPKVEEKSAPLLVDEYFNKSEERKTYKLDFSEAFKELGNTNQKKNPEIEKYFDESKGKSFKRSFSQAVQHIEPSVNKILVSQQKKVENGVLDYLKPGTPISSADVCKSDKSVEIEMKVKKSVVNDDTLHISEEIPKKAPLKVDDYFQESLERNTYRREISEAFQEIGNVEKKKNPEIEKYLDTSTTQKSFQRSFSEAAQEMAPSINKILVDSPKTDSTELKDLHELRDNQRSRTSSIGSDSSRAHGKKLGIDKFFATSLYRNAYHRSPLPVADDIGGDANELSILEDDDLVAQLDGDTRDSKQDGVGLLIEDDIRSNISEGGQKQDATFWRELLKSERE